MIFFEAATHWILVKKADGRYVVKMTWSRQATSVLGGKRRPCLPRGRIWRQRVAWRRERGVGSDVLEDRLAMDWSPAAKQHRWWYMWVYVYFCYSSDNITGDIWVRKVLPTLPPNRASGVPSLDSPIDVFHPRLEQLASIHGKWTILSFVISYNLKIFVYKLLNKAVSLLQCTLYDLSNTYSCSCVRISPSGVFG
jgi:hypothetical protein